MASSSRSRRRAPRSRPTVARLSTDCGVESTARSSVSGSPVGRDQPGARGGAAARRGLPLAQRAETGLGDAGQGHVGHPRARPGSRPPATGRRLRRRPHRSRGPRDGPLRGLGRRRRDDVQGHHVRGRGRDGGHQRERQTLLAQEHEAASVLGHRAGTPVADGIHMSTKCHSSNRGPQGLPANYKVVIRQPCKGILAGCSTGLASREGQTSAPSSSSESSSDSSEFTSSSSSSYLQVVDALVDRSVEARGRPSRGPAPGRTSCGPSRRRG